MRKQLRHITIQSGRNVMFLLLLLLTVLQAGAQTIGGNVYGGGEKGEVKGNSEVTIKSGKLGTFAAGGVTSGGNVYGGGNAGNLLGHTTVTLQGGNICGGVFGGAQQADVKKYTYINIDGAHQLHDLTVNRVYGGNDVSGVIGADQGGTVGATTGLPFTPDVNTPSVTVDNTFQSFIQATKEQTSNLNIFIGQMFGGGNGDYDYTTGDANSNPYFGKSAPTVAKTYLQVNGGTYGYVFAGGNNATVTENTVISINNTSTVTTATDNLNLENMTALSAIQNGTASLENPVDLRLLSMGINISTFHTGHHFNRVFGGNNKADMSIMPHWNLTAGSIHDLYSGGNEGRMINSQGILLEIKSGSEIIAENVYGGCRKADVRPLAANGRDMDNSKIQLADENYHFPPGFSARVLVRDGTIRNVYGGNDISGKVYGGNAVGVYTSILGDVFGGGNGSYAYTDRSDLKDDLIWGDFYYDPGSSSIDSLNAHRPNAEQVSLRLKGTSENQRTIIGGSVYVGGNSATLASTKPSPTVELKIGSHVIAENVYLGNNGANMIDNTILQRYAGTVTKADQSPGHDFSSLNLTESETFAKYMDGCAMTIKPSVKFDGDDSTDKDHYDNYTTFFGSFFGGGNVGSMIMPGQVTLNFNKAVTIYNKLVGGCNNANIAAQDGLNAAYKGGVIGTAGEQSSYTENGKIKDRLELNLNGVRLEPMRWKVRVKSPAPTVGESVTDLFYVDAQGNIIKETSEDAKAVSGRTYYEYDLDGTTQPQLQYNVYSRSTGQPIIPYTIPTGTGSAPSADDLDRRLIGANVYGGCYNSGHVNGNIIINLDSTIHDRASLFDETSAALGAKLYDGDFTITARHTGVLLNEQGMDALGAALNVFGGGYGADSEVWGSATVNLKKGYTFQIFGGGENGFIGKKSSLSYHSDYSTYVNLSGTKAGDGTTTGDENMPECEFIYGGGFKGDILGDTHVNLGNGRIFNSFAGSCDADIYGHTETYVGRKTNSDSNSEKGFPWVIDHIYGGNDLGGKIKSTGDFTSRISATALPKVYQYDATNNSTPEVTKASAYVEYQQGRVENIFGGAYGDYDYDVAYAAYADRKPYMESAFVNFKPLQITGNSVSRVFGAGQGHDGGTNMNSLQNRSYVLIDIPQTQLNFLNTEVFGAGAFSGVGMYANENVGVSFDAAKTNSSGVVASAVVDLVRGQIAAAYGGSFEQGVTRRTIVNVPTGSTIDMGSLFGGAYGVSNAKPCDVYEANVNYRSADARIPSVYGGNNAFRRTLYGKVNVYSPVKYVSEKDGLTFGTVYGGGYGKDSWSQYTEVNILDGGKVMEAYGGGYGGDVLNKVSAAKKATESSLSLALGAGYDNSDATNDHGGLTNYLTGDNAAMYAATGIGEQKHNTNVHIYEGGSVVEYVYGGGYGQTITENSTTYTSGNVSGSTYVDLLGGTVGKDIYAAGTNGPVMDKYGLKSFTASANAYIQGGTCRNVYGGGWRGSVGYHDPSKAPTTNSDLSTDILGESNVVIGNLTGDSFTNGIPAIQRNAYGGGEGGGIFGTANVTLLNGYIGYNYDDSRSDNIATTDFDEHYQEELDDKESGDNQLYEAGNIFGGGYVANSYVDVSNVKMYGGVVRNSLYGGGEIGPIGRGTVKDGLSIAKAGESHVYLYKGYVKRNVFGGGRGFDSWKGNGWMTDEEKLTMDLSSKGYVFGSTDVNIYGGEIGTEEGIGKGYGNVFGGGNLGYVYSKKGTKRADGYYYDSSSKLTEDCRVVVKPYCQVTNGTITHNTDTYNVGDYVPTEVLDTYKYNDSKWGQVDNTGIIIHNAVFAGGNVSTGSDRVYANTKTVFGNATASIVDIFDKDLITLGEDGIGGLYGEGNLTFVDGYRELNITNYGTDYEHLNEELTHEAYQQLNKRQQAYYELKYKATVDHTYEYYLCNTTHSYNNVTYKKGQKVTELTWSIFDDTEKNKWSKSKQSTRYAEDEQITENEFALMDADEQANWDLYGFCTLFKGRMINTIQRADFCGVFGSRVVLRGAQDRVPSVVDYTDYTINRVDELSLNKKTNTSVDATNGNYFGIYNVVNYLGALTSDVDFTDTRTTTSADYPVDSDHPTYYDYKHHNLSNRSRNNGTSENEVALSSGVWLEILNKSTETAGKKVYGPITGVVQLDLINVATGEGGGYVYAKNIHGVRKSSGVNQVTLAAANDDANSYKKWSYADVQPGDKMQTSGNFINPGKRIIDDCYPTSGAYYGASAAPAHYWFVRGEYYVYDQYISAYTGSSQAYAEVVSIPLTITAESQGRLQLESVKPNLYAYWDEETTDATLLAKYKSKTEDNAIIVGGITYQKNDPISYWAWSHLTVQEQGLFTNENTYVCTNTATYGGKTYNAGDVFITTPPDIYVCTQQYKDDEETIPAGTVITATEYAALDVVTQSRYAIVFNPSNVLNKENGFVLTFDWDNPDIWNDYYHKVATDEKIRASLLSHVTSDYTTSPSFKCTTGGVYGRHDYGVGELIGKSIYDQGAYDASTKFAEAYVAKENCKFTVNSTNYQYVKGACVPKSLYDTFGTTNQSYFDVGMLCSNTYEKSETEYYLHGTVIPQSEYTTLLSADSKVSSNFSKAYICTTAGKWGGETFEVGHNYPAVKYSNLSADERANFTYNYDALNLLIDDTYSNIKYYDSKEGNSATLYAQKQPIDYTATYNGAGITLTKAVDITRGGSPLKTENLQTGDILSNTVYESLINYQYNYTPIVVQEVDGAIPDNYYVVKEAFQVGDKAYIPGNQIKEEVYNTLSVANQNKISVVASSTLSHIEALPTGTDVKRYYFCTKAYGDKKVGDIISTESYSGLTNEQRGFTIDGLIPSETSTLYVAREANIDQLSEDKIITVAYWYDYVESDETGSSYENIREKHIVNIHIHFESGVPTIGELSPPTIVLPGDKVSLNEPTVTKGAYEILGGGWEIFPTEAEALSHQNGEDYVNASTPMYWYQDGYYVSYYAKSYLGKTYSNPVKISVANYHRMNDVMTNTHEVITDNTIKKMRDYMYIDEAVEVGKRNPKVYIGSTSELDYLKKFYDLSKTKTIDTLSHVRDGANLDFIVDNNIEHTEAWISIGDDGQCFEGTLHGDGYTISGLNNSLFNYLCGSVYNLGVTGTFTGAGVAETGDGYVENCWISTTGTPAADTYAVFGNPSATESAKQIVNCYYPSTKTYKATASDHGVATAKSEQAFYNGEVAYDLNGFYLFKRYCDQKAAVDEDEKYSFYDGDTSEEPKNKYYTSYPELCSSGYKDKNDNIIMYVEDRIADGDFVYAGGTIPEVADERQYTDGEYYPIWPDDYIFFGQTLNYGHIVGRTHQELPSHIMKGSGRIQTTKGNRVYRAPAYFQNSKMQMAHFNPDAVFAQTKKGDDNVIAYKGMTAIDFTGYGESDYLLGKQKADTPYTNITDGAFYPPLLDDGGLNSFNNVDLTKNLLVYIPQATATATDAVTKTNTAVTEYLPDVTYSETNTTYRTVAAASTTTIHGHRVVKDAEGGGYTADVDHLLVDKQDFNAPISYTFANDKRMWYQRTPDTYVDLTKGWEGISIPFSAEVVTTQTKGEITHFYSGSQNITGSNAKIGHEYWLREFKGIKAHNTEAKVDTAAFNYPDAITNGVDKECNNTYLWDYYYSKSSQQDANTDIYQTYYKDARTYSDYAYSVAAKPYIIGFPGKTYYEFDLSGQFKPKNTYSDIAAIDQQVITFASKTGAAINVSDTELTDSKVADDGYIFTPNYLGKSIAAGAYMLNADGSAYQETTTATPAVPFRPYFTKTACSRSTAHVESIIFGSTTDIENNSPSEGSHVDEDLIISSQRGKIIVESRLKGSTDVRIYTLSGVKVNTFTIRPGETIETPIHTSGVYIVRSVEGSLQMMTGKKLRVKGSH